MCVNVYSGLAVSFIVSYDSKSQIMVDYVVVENYLL